ncbi:MAG: hypothetical protein H6741_04555 [Alphaproteobacteria bacterium]|nr:hypothetical protein [Alphaproteobacteria bacterium]MCB9791978.1 hypothetical protein [Alphaproteobacteria bacterium]
MSYHYIREPGEEGSILTVESDQAAGVDLATLIERERPPLRAGLEIASALADILTIAEEDGAFHGDVKPGEVFVDATGSVALAGYGVPRRTTRAPESHPQGMQTDVFGLGVVLHALLSDHPLGRLPQDPDGHDEEIIQRVWAMDFSEVEGKRWLDDVRTFLCKILAFYPDDRPMPLDAANVLAQVASQCPGRPLAAWASRAVPAAGGEGAQRRPAAPISEDLGGPQALSTPMPQGIGGFSPQRTAPSSKGESTAFWSKDRIAAMLADEDDESDELPPPVDRTRQARQLDNDGRPRPGTAPQEDLGGPSAASFGGGLPPAQPSWGGNAASAAPPWGAAPEPPAPPPPLSELPAQDSPSEAFFKSGDAMQDPEPPPAWEPHSRPAQGPPPPVTPPRPPSGPIAISGPTPDQVAAAEPDIPRPPTGGGKGKIIAVVVVVMLLGCMGIAGLGGGYWWFTMGPGAAADGDETPSEVEAPTDPEVNPPEPRDTDVPEADPPKEEPPAEEPPKEAPKVSTPPKTTTTSGSGSTESNRGGTRKTTTPPPPKETTPPPAETSTLASGQSEVRISFADNAEKVSLTCGDGQKRSFNGSTSMSFTGTVTCRVKQGKNMGVFTVNNKSGTVSCSEDSRGINCTGP